MLEALLKQRRAGYERRIRDISYDMAELDKRRAQMQAALSELSGAVYEIDQTLKDLNNQAAIDAAKETE